MNQKMDNRAWVAAIARLVPYIEDEEVCEEAVGALVAFQPSIARVISKVPHTLEDLRAYYRKGGALKMFGVREKIEGSIIGALSRDAAARTPEARFRKDALAALDRKLGMTVDFAYSVLGVMTKGPSPYAREAIADELNLDERLLKSPINFLLAAGYVRGPTPGDVDHEDCVSLTDDGMHAYDVAQGGK